jgi:CrcB protein
VSRHPLRPAVLAVVAGGGAVGACLRWALEAAYGAGGGSFPWTTFCINVVGSTLLALLPALPVVQRSPLLPPALGTGVLGGFTTMSTYSDETRSLLAGGHAALASAYSVGTLAACLAGVALASRLAGSPMRSRFDAEEGDL